MAKLDGSLLLSLNRRVPDLPSRDSHPRPLAAESAMITGDWSRPASAAAVRAIAHAPPRQGDGE
jgi:hypothetical protein